MEYKLIEPWVEEELPIGTLVPEYIEKIALDVVKHYDFSLSSMEVMATKPERGGAIWKIETSKGPKSLKLLHRRPLRSLFVLEVQDYLVKEKKARIPAIVRTKDGEMHVMAGGKVWFVAEWIEELTPVQEDLEGLKMLCRSMADFNMLTRGLVPSKDVDYKVKIHKWPKKYKKIVDKLGWFRNIANAYRDMPASPLILDVIDEFQEDAKRAYERLITSPEYRSLVAKGPFYWGLVHQDFGFSNSQMGPGGMWVIDLDGIAYDFPIRDLRKLISSTMADKSSWDVETVREMIKAFHEQNPISKEMYELLLIDLSLPNDFYKYLKEMVYEPEIFLNEETAAMIEQLVKAEKSKWAVLNEIKKDWAGVK